MTLEATMIIVDNSESSRNGDYTSTRWQAQVDAVSVIHSVKMRANPQSAVGLMSMGGKGPEVLSTFTTEFGGILAGLHSTKIHGTSHFSSSIQVAGLALKHRSEKSQRQRIIVFSCSSIAEEQDSLVKLAKKMKKNNVSIDVIAFGDLESDQTKKLEVFVETVNSKESSNLAIIPPGPYLLSEQLQSTGILGGENTRGASATSGGDGGDAGGFNFEDAAEDDPELAFALRLSLEEEKNRQEKEKRDQEAQEGKTELGEIPEEGHGESSGAKDKDEDKMDTA